MKKRLISDNKVRSALVVLAIVVLLAAGVFVAVNRYNARQSADANRDPLTGDSINFSPATDEEKQETEAHKKNLADGSSDQSESGTEDGTKQNTNVVITSAGQFEDNIRGNRVEVRAFMPNIFEAGGVCTTTFTKGSETFSRNTEAQEDATTTRCSTLIVPRTEFPSMGEWSVAVSYSSSKYSGSSSTVKVEVK